MFRIAVSGYGGVVIRNTWWRGRDDGGKGKSFPPPPTCYRVASGITEIIIESIQQSFGSDASKTMFSDIWWVYLWLGAPDPPFPLLCLCV